MMMPIFRAAGENGIYAFFEQKISPEVSRQVLSFMAAVEEAVLAGALPGVVEIVPAYASALVYFNPEVIGQEELVAALGAVAETATRRRLPPPRRVEIPVCYGGEFGPDLPAVAKYAGISEKEVVRLHTARQYLVYCLGFSPGFAFMGTVDKKIAIGRLDTPRPAVAPGSVGIAGLQTGIYPAATPGGWRLIGRTPIDLLPGLKKIAPTENAVRAVQAGPEPDWELPVLLRPGDVVSFRAISEAEFARLLAEAASSTATSASTSAAAPEASFPRGPAVAPALTPPAMDAIEVLSPGALTTVQDEGRTGWQRYGFAPAGPCDANALRIANLLVGNPPEKPGAAGLECTLTGPTLRFRSRAVVAITGADMAPRLNGEPVPMGTALTVNAGDVLALGSVRPAGAGGLRTYIAIRGGIAVPPFLGSRATDISGGVGGLGGRALRRGDVLPLAPLASTSETVEPCDHGADYNAGHEAGYDAYHGVGREAGREAPKRSVAAYARRAFDRLLRLRLITGPDDDLFAPEDVERFFATTFRVSPLLDRKGIRLEGELEGGVRLRPRSASVAGKDSSASTPALTAANIISKPIPLGAVQVPPDGQPIVLLVERPTLGGYPVIGVIPEADVNRLAQAGAGTVVRFVRFVKSNRQSARRALPDGIAELVALFARHRDLAELSVSDDGRDMRIRLARHVRKM